MGREPPAWPADAVTRPDATKGDAMSLQQELSGAAQWLVPLLVFAAVLVVGIVLRVFAFRMLHRWSAKTTTKLDDFIIAATRWPSIIWIVILGALAAFQIVDLPGDAADTAVRRILTALLIFSITIGLARLLGDLAMNYRQEAAPELALASTGLLRTIVRAAVLLTGFLVMLSTVGIDIGPLLGALGVGGLAAGLALQPTLSNLFAGFQIAAGKQVRIGNRVRLASGEDGYVTDISWRTTTLRTPTNALIIIPNSRFADSIVTNVNLPEAPTNIVIPVSISYASDPRHVESVLRDETKRAIADLPELVPDFEPIVRLQAFGQSSLDFQVIVRVRDFDAQFPIWGELHQRLFARLRREAIGIPFPTRTVHLSGMRPEGPAS
jgi:small-conductance mechanosensitive channel